MSKLVDFNPLKSIAIPNIGRVQLRGLVVVIGPNSSGKSQMLKDIQGRMLGQPRKLVVCEDIELHRQSELEPLLEHLYEEGHIKKRVDAQNNIIIDSQLPQFGGEGQNTWSVNEEIVKQYYNKSVISGPDGVEGDKFLEHFGRFFLSSLFLDRRLTLANSVASFDYETTPPANELQTLYLNQTAKCKLMTEVDKVFGKAIWLDNTRAKKLCLRIADNGQLPSAEDRLEPEKMRSYRLIEDEGDGFRSYVGTCVTLLLGERPVCLIDEPEMCLHPPQAYAIGKFIGKYGALTDHATFVATHSSHVLRGIIEQTEQLEIIRLTRDGSRFSGHRVSHESIRACIEKPSTKVETILDGLFAEAVTIVEGEGDRLVYSTTWERLASEFNHDVHFVSMGGIGGIADTCRLYRNLKIPVCVIADLDLLRELGTFEQVVKSLCSAEQLEDVMTATKKIIAAIEGLGPIHSETELQSELKGICESKLDWSDVKQLKNVRRTLSGLSAGLSQTARLKGGLESLKSHSLHPDLKALLATCRSFGLFLVPCGELEDWVPSLMEGGPSKRKKAEWANFAANKIREAPAGDDDIWSFIRQMAKFQTDEASRLSGYVV